jgi:hypothetical protein
MDYNMIFITGLWNLTDRVIKTYLAIKHTVSTPKNNGYTFYCYNFYKLNSKTRFLR